MNILEIILLVVGLLTIVVGASCFRESNNNSNDFNISLGKLHGDITTKTGVIGYYNAKCNALSLYGCLVVAYGIIISGIAMYLLVPEQNKHQFLIVTGILIAVGICFIFAAMFVKKLHHPNPASYQPKEK